jgi:glycosyltransferase involved in cell wall biosynthesis
VSHRPTLIIVTEKQLFPIDEGNRARIVTMIRSLRLLGFRVVLVARRPTGLRATLQTRWLVEKLIPVDTERFVPGSPLAYDCSAFIEPLRSAVRRFSPVAVIAEYIWMAPCLDVVEGDAVRIIDTHDLMHVRREFANKLSHGWVDTTPEEERSLLEKADVVIAIQPRELEHFRALVPSKKVLCVPHYVSESAAVRSTDRPLAIIVGSDNPGNVDGLTAFLEEAWPAVRNTCPNAELKIYGLLANRAAPAEGMIRVGYVTDLRAAYREASVIINPLRFGTGLKIKTVEALARGKAVVTTACGAQGLEHGAGRAFLVEDDMKRFAEAVSQLLNDNEARKRLERAAYEFARREFSLEQVYGGLLEVLHNPATENTAQRALAQITTK